MFNKEPALIFNGLAEILRQLVPFLIVFGFVHWTDVQIAAVFALSSVVLSFGSAAFTRSQSVSFDTANKQIVKAVNSPVGTRVEDVVAAVKEEG